MTQPYDKSSDGDVATGSHQTAGPVSAPYPTGQYPASSYPSGPYPTAPGTAPTGFAAHVYGPPGYGTPPRPGPQTSNGLSIAGFVCGLLGVILLILPYVGVVLGILGICLSVPGRNRARRTGQKTGLATAGLVLGIIAVAGFLILLIAFLASWGSFGVYR